MITRARHAGVAAVFVTVSATVIAQPLNACTALSADEIKAALGRADLGVATPGKASGGVTDCRFPGAGAGDVRITLGPPEKDAAADFDLKEQVLTDERKKFDKVVGVGDRAFYYDDNLEFRVGDRLVALWVNRTPRTEAAPAVKTALIALGTRMAERLRRK